MGSRISCDCARSRPAAVAPDDAENQKLMEGYSKDGKEANDSAEEKKGEEKEDTRGDCCACICMCCCFLIFGVLQAVVWARVPGCNAKADELSMTQMQTGWNSIIPPRSMTQMQNGWEAAYKGSQVYVYDESKSNTTEIGYWVSTSMFFNWMQKYTYVQMVNGTEIATLEAFKPWGLYWGLRFNIFRCEKEDDQYMVEEDATKRSWFSWNKVRVYNIKDSTGNIVAYSKHEHNIGNVFSWGQSFWSAVLKAPNGTVAAAIVQDKPTYGGASSFLASSASIWTNIHQKWRMWNQWPGIVPNEIVSLLLAMYDLDRAASDDDSSTT